jgi:hypothetical protein
MQVIEDVSPQTLAIGAEVISARGRRLASRGVIALAFALTACGGGSKAVSKSAAPADPETSIASGTTAGSSSAASDRPRAVLDPSGGSSGPSVATMPWLQPYPDALLDELVSDQPDPEMLASRSHWPT